MRATKLSNTAACPVCEKLCNGVADPSGERRPKHGDTSVCSGCLEVLVFEGDLGHLRLPTHDELRQFHAEGGESINDTRFLILSINRGRPWR